MPLDDSEEEGTDMESDLEEKKEDGRNEISCLHPTFGFLSHLVF